MDSRHEAIERALGYPFPAPARSYLLRDGEAQELDPSAVETAGRVALCAYGSNAAPDVLATKLGPDAEPVAVVRDELKDFDAVYSAHIAAYGSVPATLRHSPGTTIPVFIANVTAEQLERIALTEPNYELETIRGHPTFVSRHGHLLMDGTPVALKRIEARGRTLPALGQREALDHVRSVMRPDLDLESFILEWVAGSIPARPLDGPEAA